MRHLTNDETTWLLTLIYNLNATMVVPCSCWGPPSGGGEEEVSLEGSGGGLGEGVGSMCTY